MLYIIRHGQTDWNVKHKLQGQTDIPLNDEGRRMAALAGEKCRDINFDICFCSPLIRAGETAELILKDRAVPIIVDNRLAEMSFGRYEGVENSFSISDCPINVLFERPEDFVAEEGVESLDELFSRTGEFLKDEIYPRLDQGLDILIVGHGAMNCSIISRIKGTDYSRFWDWLTGNCELIKLL